MKETNKNVKRPCIGCKYFKACGNTNRTAPCEGRDINKTEKKPSHKKGAY